MEQQHRVSSSQLVDQLSRNSAPYHDPLTRIAWDTLDRERFWLPEQAISLYGVPAFMALPEETRRTLSQYEFLNTIEAGLWLEGLFMTRISREVLKSGANLAQLNYHLHELREEAGHSLMFVELIRRSGLQRPPTRFYSMRLANQVGRYAPFESLPFWIAVLIGEEVPDRLNRFIIKHNDQVCQAVEDMSRIHIIDEARHIAHAKETLEARFDHMPRWQIKLVSPLIQRIFGQFVRALYLPPAGLYEMAGLEPGRDWEKAARNNPHRIRFIDEMVSSSLRSLKDHGIELNWR